MAWEPVHIPIGVYSYRFHATEEGTSTAYSAQGHITVLQ